MKPIASRKFTKREKIICLKNQPVIESGMEKGPTRESRPLAVVTVLRPDAEAE